MPLKVEGANSEDGLIGEILGELPPEDQAKVSIAIAQFRSHRGPMPSPETLAAYKEVDPRLVDSVIDGFNENRRHRIGMDQHMATTARQSLYLCAAIVALAIVLAAVLALLGHEVAAAIFGAGGLGSIIVTLIRGGGVWSGKDHDESPRPG